VLRCDLFETSRYVIQSAQCDSPENFILEYHSCEDLRSRYTIDKAVKMKDDGTVQFCKWLLIFGLLP